jgi:hypothetical protein
MSSAASRWFATRSTIAMPCQNRTPKNKTDSAREIWWSQSPSRGGRARWTISTAIMLPSRNVGAAPRNTDQIIAERVITSDQVDGIAEDEAGRDLIHREHRRRQQEADGEPQRDARRLGFEAQESVHPGRSL